MSICDQDRMNWREKGKKDIAFEEYFFTPRQYAFA
jgi:hypothetical protein